MFSFAVEYLTRRARGSSARSPRAAAPLSPPAHYQNRAVVGTAAQRKLFLRTRGRWRHGIQAGLTDYTPRLSTPSSPLGVGLGPDQTRLSAGGQWRLWNLGGSRRVDDRSMAERWTQQVKAGTASKTSMRHSHVCRSFRDGTESTCLRIQRSRWDFGAYQVSVHSRKLAFFQAISTRHSSQSFRRSPHATVAIEE